MSSWPIWNDVTACAYKAPKSYGVKETGLVTVRVGTSASNSHKFVNHATTHRHLEDGSREYRFYLDGECVRRAVLAPKATKLEYLDP